MDVNQELLQAVVDVLRSEGHLQGDQSVSAGTPLTDGGVELTSLDLVRVLVTLEDRLGVELDDSAIMNANFATVGDLADVVSSSAHRVEATVGGNQGDDGP